MIKRLLFGWLLALSGLHAWAALPPELLTRIAAGEGDERVAALNEAVAQADPALADYLQALLDGRVRLREGKALVAAEGAAPPEGEEPMLNNRLRREIDSALAGLALLSKDRDVRAKALATLREDASAAKLPLYERALAAETDAKLRDQLGSLVAGAKLSSTDAAQRRAAAAELAGSADPTTRALLLERIGSETDAATKAAMKSAIDAIGDRLAWGRARAAAVLRPEPRLGAPACRVRPGHHLRPDGASSTWPTASC